MSKGDNRRPTLVEDEEFDKRWEMAFGKRKLNIMEDGGDGKSSGDNCVAGDSHDGGSTPPTSTNDG